MRRTLQTALGILILVAAPATAGEVGLVAAGSAWKVLDDGTDPGTAWRGPLFDDATWRRGEAQLGYGDGDEITLVRCRVGWPLDTPCPGGGTADRILTTYFRRFFQVDDPAAFDTLTLRLLVDDGAAVYLNGQEVLRFNLPAGEVTSGTAATVGVANEAENVFTEHALLPGALDAGTNVLAVEVHQWSGASSDVSFDLELIAGAPGLPALVRGPYLQLGTPDGATLRWRTDVPVASRVLYGDAPDALTQVAVDPTLRTEHAVRLGGLEAFHRYFYALATADAVLLPADEQRSFLTAPPPGTSSLTRVWVLGDSGTANAVAAAVRDGYRLFNAGRTTHLWLMLGDNAYTTGTEAQYQAAVFEMYPNELRNTWLWPTIGNHDALTSDSPTQTGPYFTAFDLPTAGEAGGLPSGTEAYYAFDWGDIHFICLDSADSDLTPGGAMLQWLQADLGNTLREWIIAFWHHPPYTKGTHDSDNLLDSAGRMETMRENVLPILESGGVDLVLTGHSHDYERSFLLDGHYDDSSTLSASMIVDAGDGRPVGDGAYEKPSADSRGAVYVVAGSSGRLGTGPLDHPAMRVSLASLGSLVLEIRGPILDAVFIDETGAVRDSFRLARDGGLFVDGFESGDLSAWSSHR